MQSAAEAPVPRLRAARIGLWQAAVTLVLVGLAVASGRGSPLGIVGGAGLLYTSLLLQHLAIGFALRPGRRAGLAMGLFLLKLAILLGVAVIGLKTTLLAPMSFAAGASTLLLAIVIDACYGNRSTSSPP
jgi:hypothetical protein